MWGVYLPRGMGIGSRIGLANSASGGEDLVSGSVEFLYSSITRWNLSTLRDPLGPVLSISILLMVLVASSARQLAVGLSTDVRRWCTPHDYRKCLVLPNVN